MWYQRPNVFLTAAGLSDNDHINGMLIVRQSIRQDPHRSLVDHDSSEHRISLKTVSNQNEIRILINGKYSQEVIKSYFSIAGYTFF